MDSLENKPMDDTVAKKKSHARQILIGAVLIVTGLYVVCLIGLTLAQRSLIYFPCKTSWKRAQNAAERRGFQVWTNARGEFIGWFRPNGREKAAAQLLLLHGNAGCATDWFHYADGFQSRGSFDFYILEYPGYGGRPAAPRQSTILSAAEDGVATMSQTCSVFLIGESLGTGPACFLAGKHGQIKGVFLVAPYNHLSAAAQKHLPLFPVKWMLRDKYPSDQWLQSYHGPLAVLLAEKDAVIPSELGRVLFDGYAGPKRLWIEPAATHDDVHKPRDEIYQEVTRFWKDTH